jgi:hypothetical protein
MRIFLYAKEGEPSGEKLEGLIKTGLPEVEMEIYRMINRLSRRLTEPAENMNIAVLLITSQEDLTSILSIHHLLQDIPKILIVPDRKAETIALAHQLRPRFLSDIHSDFDEVTAVLKKMLKEHS